MDISLVLVAQRKNILRYIVVLFGVLWLHNLLRLVQMTSLAKVLWWRVQEGNKGREIDG